MKLSNSDIRILKALQRDGRQSNQELAGQVGMSTSACWRRVKALEEAGAIQKYAAILDAASCGLEFHAILQVVLSRHEPDKLDDFTRAIAHREEIIDCFSTTGDADYHLRVVCKNKDAYNRFLEDFLFRQPVVSTVRTNLILREIKQHTPIAPDVESP